MLKKIAILAFVDDPIIEPPLGNIPSALPSSAVLNKT